MHLSENFAELLQHPLDSAQSYTRETPAILELLTLAPFRSIMPRYGKSLYFRCVKEASAVFYFRLAKGRHDIPLQHHQPLLQVFRILGRRWSIHRDDLL